MLYPTDKLGNIASGDPLMDLYMHTKRSISTWRVSGTAFFLLFKRHTRTKIKDKELKSLYTYRLMKLNKYIKWREYIHKQLELTFTQ